MWYAFISSEEVHGGRYRSLFQLPLSRLDQNWPDPRMFAIICHRLSGRRGELGAVDIVSVSPDMIVRDVTFDVQEAQWNE